MRVVKMIHRLCLKQLRKSVHTVPSIIEITLTYTLKGVPEKIIPVQERQKSLTGLHLWNNTPPSQNEEEFQT